MCSMTIIVIHGGTVFDSENKFYDYLRNTTLDPFEPPSQKWRNWLRDSLDEPVIVPKMPNKQNAQYEEWKIWFERQLEFVEGKLILVGHSLGAVFLVKYLSENTLDVDSIFLIATPMMEKDIGNESLVSFSPDVKLIGNIHIENIHIFHSEDDPVVPISHSELLHETLGGQFHRFSNKQHFNQETFPELLEEIKKYL